MQADSGVHRTASGSGGSHTMKPAPGCGEDDARSTAQPTNGSDVAAATQTTLSSGGADGSSTMYISDAGTSTTSTHSGAAGTSAMPTHSGDAGTSAMPTHSGDAGTSVPDPTGTSSTPSHTHPAALDQSCTDTASSQADSTCAGLDTAATEPEEVSSQPHVADGSAAPRSVQSGAGPGNRVAAAEPEEVSSQLHVAAPRRLQSGAGPGSRVAAAEPELVSSQQEVGDDAAAPRGLQVAAGSAGFAPGAGGGSAAAGGRRVPRVAGLESTMQILREVVGWPMMYREEGAALGVRWPRGLLLHGPPGCGKTALVQAIAAEFGAALHVVTAASVVGAYMGESERRLREAFQAAADSTIDGRPAIVFLDEVDALCPRRDGQRQAEARLVAQLLALMDGAAGGAAAGAGAGAGGARKLAAAAGGHVAVIAATNRPNAIDPALRRPGRLDREVAVGVPGAVQRGAILRLHTASLALQPDVDLDHLAAACHGYTGADLAALAREAAMAALSRAAALLLGGTPGPPQAGTDASSTVADGLLPVAGVCAADFDAAMHRVGPSLVRGAEVEVEPVAWDDIGGLESVKQRLQQAVEWPLQHAQDFARLGLAAPRGVLLYGPPGCAKTSLARAAASASRATMLPLSCAQLFSMYVGEGEATLRGAFARARLAAPSIIFLDEIDAVAGRREDDGSQGGSEAGLRLLSTLLTEMDGLELATGVLVLAATNRPQALDAALLRPGRFDALLLVPPPDEAGRLQALTVHTRGMPLAGDVDLPAIARDTHLFTGAEIAALCREAALGALREDLQGAQYVACRHFAAARAALRPALTEERLAQYGAWGKRHRT